MVWRSLLFFVAVLMVLHLSRLPEHVCKALEQRRYESEDCNPPGSCPDTDTDMDCKGDASMG